MIKSLEIAKAPFRVEILDGISFVIAPLSLADLSVCQAIARRRVDDICESVSNCREIGLLPREGEDMSASDLREGIYRSQLIKEIGCRHIQGWEGVKFQGGDDDAPVTPEAVAVVLADPIIGEKFYIAVTRQLTEIAIAKKEFGIVPPGISGRDAVPSIVNPAS